MTPADFKQARQSLGLTQVQMARVLGFTRQAHVSDMEAGRTPITEQTRRLVDLYLDGARPPDWPGPQDMP